MQLHKVNDPRGYLEKLSRKELEYTAQYYKIEDVRAGMPAPLMRDIIAKANPPKIPVPIRQKIGMYAEHLRVPPYDIWKHTQFGEPTPKTQEEKGETVDATADLARQWETESAPEPEKRVPRIVKLRQECKAKGIPWKKTDKMVDLEAKLNGENTPSIGQ